MVCAKKWCNDFYRNRILYSNTRYIIYELYKSLLEKSRQEPMRELIGTNEHKKRRLCGKK